MRAAIMDGMNLACIAKQRDFIAEQFYRNRFFTYRARFLCWIPEFLEPRARKLVL